MNVEAAAKVFNSTLRMHLIRYYLTNPGPQRAAIEALQVSQRAISTNTRDLVSAGVLVTEPSGNRSLHTYRVDVDRVRELLDATAAFVIGGADVDGSHAGVDDRA